MSLTVDIAGLKTACSDLEKSRQEIMDSYNKQVKSVLENSNSCFYVAGLRTDAIVSNFNKIYNEFNNNISSLLDVLNDTINNYGNLQDILTNSFNNTFAEKLESLIPGVSLSTSGGVRYISGSELKK